MSAWDDVQKAIRSGALERTVRLVSELDEPGRRAVAKELPGALKKLRAASEFGFLDPKVVQAFLLAGAGTISGAAAAAGWLSRADLRPWWDKDEYCPILCDLTSIRPDEWRAEVAHRVAARLRTSEQNWAYWHIAAALGRSAGAAPASDGFVVGWVTEGGRPRGLAEDPFLDALVPRLFEVDGVGAALAFDQARPQWDESRKGAWASALADLAKAGRLDRTTLLDGCVSRFLRARCCSGRRRSSSGPRSPGSTGPPAPAAGSTRRCAPSRPSSPQRRSTCGNGPSRSRPGMPARRAAPSAPRSGTPPPISRPICAG
ncbi:hypothetical protein ETD83_31655 [Actinomadura soli]|uniref:Uncharacterized protein n=1 Tax=Actinomadura soli TaxID=2508997 RepID=A0A5C4J362_9ACTN|nr:hypothetical protein [Actinomadura soli]TMQ91285.1 hypothetical protein ETD83_31655 [Actinomadura soli]